jgi:hypothetical protein
MVSTAAIDVKGALTVTNNPKLTRVQLARVADIRGPLTVSTNAALTAIDLGTAEHTGAITIADNAALTTITMRSLRATKGLSILRNAALVEVAEMPALKAISGKLELRSNGQLATMGAMAALQIITGNVHIDHNDKLTAPPRMSALTSVTGRVDILDNPALASLDVFPASGLTIDHTLFVGGNANLTNLGSLKKLAALGKKIDASDRAPNGGIYSLIVMNSPRLSACRALEIASCVSHPASTVFLRAQRRGLLAEL